MKLVNIRRQSTDHQVYMQSFCEAWIKCGGEWIEPSQLSKNRMATNVMKLLALCHLLRPCRSAKLSGQSFVVCARGGHLLKAAVPYMTRGEIVPMLWDCWPDTWAHLTRDLRLLHVRRCYVTASDVARELGRLLPDIEFIHIPEGVDIDDYQPGSVLAARTIDVYELGDKHRYYHKRLVDDPRHESWNFVYKKAKPAKGPALVFDSWQEYTSKIADSRIIISFPRSMRDPRRNGTVSTLTIRYWEAMLSRSIIVGHCPQELIDIVGYNPVIEADFTAPGAQIEHILTHIEEYQSMVDHNRDTALKYASWVLRIKQILG